MITQKLTELELAVLRFLRDISREQFVGSWARMSTIIREFGDEGYEAVNTLLSKKYITNTDLPDGLKVSALGKSFLESQKNIEINSFNNISHSNISNKSENTKQVVGASAQDRKIQQKAHELEQAVKARNSKQIKKLFNYIIDNSVDVAIALLTNKNLK